MPTLRLDGIVSHPRRGVKHDDLLPILSCGTVRLRKRDVGVVARRAVWGIWTEMVGVGDWGRRIGRLLDRGRLLLGGHRCAGQSRARSWHSSATRAAVGRPGHGRDMVSARKHGERWKERGRAECGSNAHSDSNWELPISSPLRLLEVRSGPIRG